MKREAGPWTELEHEDYHVTKGVLLHVLGNAALSRSRRHLVRHATPNTGHHIWRRAALDALRHYTCEESARVLLDCMLRDDVFSVRRMALAHYVNHPRRSLVTKEEENVMLSKDYTYPSVARVKRNIFDKVLFQFKVELPSFDYNKQLGSKLVGAGFGVSFHNSVDGMFRLLSGYASVNVNDKMWAEANIGLIDYHLDLFRAEVCYRGRLFYNMNLVKDFTVGLYEDITSAFDHIANRVLEPMEKAANDLASNYHDPQTGQAKSGFEPLSNAVKQLPDLTGGALKSTEDMSKAANALSSMPLADDKNVGDAAITALPFSEKEIRQTVNTVLDNMDKITDYPQQALGVIDRAKMSYQMAMQRILEGNKIIKQAMSFLSAGKSTWMNAGEEIEHIVASTKDVIGRLKVDFARRKRETSPFGDLGQTISSGVDMALDALYVKSDDMLQNLIHVSQNGPADLQHGFDQQQVQVEILKASFQAFKEAIDMIKSRIHALFGMKFHHTFPNFRRDCDDVCKCGTFPTDCTRYGHPGVDVILEQGWNVPSPVAGLVYTEADSNTIRIVPKTPDFKDYEIFISNIVVNDNFTHNLMEPDSFAESGQSIGTANGANGCNKDHIHVAMKRKSPDTGQCFYVDPSPFLDTMQAIPKWQQECKEFTFKHIGQVVDFRNMTKGFAEAMKVLKRLALTVGKQILVKSVEELVPDDSLLAPFKDVALEFVKNIDVNASDLKNMFAPGRDAAKDFFKQTRATQFTLKGVTNMVADSNILAAKVPRISRSVRTARDIARRPPMDTAKSLAMGVMSRALTKRPIRTAECVPGFEGLFRTDSLI
nr:hypothetical protein BaRGS_029596 [Batillaria attramentaria]